MNALLWPPELQEESVMFAIAFNIRPMELTIDTTWMQRTCCNAETQLRLSEYGNE